MLDLWHSGSREDRARVDGRTMAFTASQPCGHPALDRPCTDSIREEDLLPTAEITAGNGHYYTGDPPRQNARSG
jgi:hypothetical protein